MLHRKCFLGVVLIALCPAFSAVKSGDPAPDIRLDQLLPDQPTANASLQALAGKAVVLEFWATWCGPCVAAIPHLNELAAQFKDRPIIFLSVTDEEPPVIKKFLEKRPIHGWVGIANTTKLAKTYGVEGIPQTFLIDRAGKLAAALSPDQLNVALLEDLLAGRPIPIFETAGFDFSVKRKTDDISVAAPLLDVIIQPSATSAGGMAAGAGKLTMKSWTLRELLSYACDISRNRIEGEPVTDTTFYDFSFNLPGSTQEGSRALVRELICAAFHVRVNRETRDTDVMVLTAGSTKPKALVESASTGGSSTRNANGRFEMVNCGLGSLAGTLEYSVGKPVVDETAIGGRYDLSLTYDSHAQQGLLEAVRKIGLGVEPARRPIEFLVVTKAQ